MTGVLRLNTKAVLREGKTHQLRRPVGVGMLASVGGGGRGGRRHHWWLRRAMVLPTVMGGPCMAGMLFDGPRNGLCAPIAKVGDCVVVVTLRGLGRPDTVRHRRMQELGQAVRAVVLRLLRGQMAPVMGFSALQVYRYRVYEWCSGSGSALDAGGWLPMDASKIPP